MSVRKAVKVFVVILATINFLWLVTISSKAGSSKKFAMKDTGKKEMLLIPPAKIESTTGISAVFPDMISLVPTPTNNEQWLLELVNEARRDPGVFGYPGEIPVPPVYFEGRLIQVARSHNNNMISGSPFVFFDHDSYTNCVAQGICWSGYAGCHPPPPPYSCTSGNCPAAVCDFVETMSDRLTSAYSPFTYLGEVLSCSSNVQAMHQQWMDSTGHRDIIMNALFREVGISYLSGGPCGALGTEDFGNRPGINPSGTGSVITGVVYEDLNMDGKYQAGEGIGGATVNAGTVTENTWSSGGFNIFPPSTGSYNITVTAPGYMANTKTGISASANLTTKIDFIMVPGTSLTNTPTPPPVNTLTPTPTNTVSNTQTPTPVVSTTPVGTSTVTFDLCQGLNLISLPLVNGSINNADTLLNSICSGGADTIWQYICATRTFNPWNILDTGTGFSTPPGLPFWVNISVPGGCSWSITGNIPTNIQYNLCLGLNLVSIPVYSTSIQWASDLLASVPNCNGVFRWGREINCSRNIFDFYGVLSTPAENFMLKPAYTYWVNVSTPGSWIPPRP